MVFFTCNACGQAVKKNQVEKHYRTQCRNCEVLSCLDCGKDFRGDEYMNHTKCISEDQKYGGKDYKPKPNSNKGEAKQEEWISQIQNRIDTTKVHPALAQLLKQLMTFSNIPRNAKKFRNFLANSVNVRNKKLIEEAWEIFSSTKEEKSKSSDNKNNPANSTHKNGCNNNSHNRLDNNNSTNSEKCTDEEPMTKKHKKSKKRKAMDNDIEQENKKPNDECTTGATKSSESEIAQTTTKKHKKTKKEKTMDNDTISELEPNANISMESGMENSSVTSNDDGCKGKKKFKWKKVIKTVLKSCPDNEISLKKLQKKQTQDESTQTEGRDWAVNLGATILTAVSHQYGHLAMRKAMYLASVAEFQSILQIPLEQVQQHPEEYTRSSLAQSNRRKAQKCKHKKKKKKK